MKTQCAWCKKITKEDNSSNLVTHGICQECIDLIENYQVSNAGEFLSNFPGAVLMVDGEGFGEAATKEMMDIVGKKDFKSIEKYPGGEIINCCYSYTSEGCGKSIHCVGCGIRESVKETYLTGQGVKNKECFNYIYKKNKITKVKIFISTEKVGNHILIKIENMEKIGESDKSLRNFLSERNK